jgi:hypothetical protein
VPVTDNPAAAPVSLRLFVPGRRGDGRQRIAIAFDATPPEAAGGLTLRRGALAADRTQVVVKYAAAAEAKELLSREVNVAEYLDPAAARLGYPESLSRVVGFDLDANPPLLVATWRGQPLAESSQDNRLPLAAAQQAGAATSLLTAVAFLAAAGYVHGGLSPRTVRWDGESLQVTDLGHATMRDRPRWTGPRVGPPGRLEDFLALAGGAAATPAAAESRGPENGFWRPPPGDGVARPGDDVYALAALLLFACTDETPEPGADLAAWLARQDHDLRRQLADAFAPDPAARPPAQQLRERVGLPTVLAAVRQSERAREHDQEQQARAHFRELGERKARFRADLAARPDAVTPAAAAAPTARRPQDFVAHLVTLHLAHPQAPGTTRSPRRQPPVGPLPVPLGRVRESWRATAVFAVLAFAMAVLVIVLVAR